MSGLTLWLALLGVELFLIVFLLLLVHWWRSVAKARRDRKAMAALVAEAKQNLAQRDEQVSEYLRQSFGLQEEALVQPKNEILREELRLLQRFAQIYRRRDATAAQAFAQFLGVGLQPYYALSGGSLGAAPAEGEADTGELQRLRSENKRLSDELTVTMDTMSRMLGEYSTMFSEKPADEEGQDDSAGAFVDPEMLDEQDEIDDLDADLVGDDAQAMMDESEIILEDEPATLDEEADLLIAEVPDEPPVAEDLDAGEELLEINDEVEPAASEELLEINDEVETAATEEPLEIGDELETAVNEEPLEIDDELEAAASTEEVDKPEGTQQEAEPAELDDDDALLDLGDEITDIDDLFDGFEDDASSDSAESKKDKDDAIAI